MPSLGRLVATSFLVSACSPPADVEQTASPDASSKSNDGSIVEPGKKSGDTSPNGSAFQSDHWMYEDGGHAMPDSSGQPNVRDATPSDAMSSEASTVCSPRFTAHVTDVAAVRSVTPLPALASGVAYEIRSYVTVKDSYAGVPVPFYAPTKMKLVGSKHYWPQGAPQGYVADWHLHFESVCDPNMSIDFAHVKDVALKVAAVSNTAIDYVSSAWAQVSSQVVFAPGEIFGYYIKGLNSIAWDFIVLDKGVTNTFANQARYSGSKYENATCPYDKYDQPLKGSYTALIAGFGQTPTGNMGCGTVMHDKVGTIAGVWFPNSDPRTGVYTGAPDGYYGSPLSAFLGEDKIVYLGNLNNSALRVDPSNPTYKDPETITTSHCFQNYPTPDKPDGYAFYQVVSNTEMRVAYSPSGVCPSSMPTAYKSYYR